MHNRTAPTPDHAPKTWAKILFFVAMVSLSILGFVEVLRIATQVHASNIVQPSGGATIQQGLFASAPSCTSAQFLYSATDAALQMFCFGSSTFNWKYKGITVTPTVVGDLPTAYNMTGASTVTYPGSWALMGTTGAPHNLHARTKAVPATPYSVVMCGEGLASGAAFAGYGTIWTDGTQAIALELTTFAAGTAPTISIEKFTNATTFSGSYLAGNTSGLSPTGSFCIAMINDGANRIEKLSHDGKNWTLIHTVGNTDFLTATQVGLYVDQGGTSIGPQFQIVSVVTLPSAL